MSSILRGAAITVVLSALALAVLPGGAYAQDDPEADGCTSEAPFPGGRCDAGRPIPDILAVPNSPRAGGEVKLYAVSQGRGLTYAWDLDDDGELDDATGPNVTYAFEDEFSRVRVRATDEDGRTGTATRTLLVHAHNLLPIGRFVGAGTRTSLRVGRPASLTTFATDVDGRVTRVELDVNGDAVYDETHYLAPDDDGLVHTSTASFSTAGTRTLRARFTDDEGETAVVTTTVDVHAQNLAPSVSVDAYPSSAKVSRTVEVEANAADLDGEIARYQFDLDGDGSYETEPAVPYARTSFATPGPHVVGVRVTDDGGASAISRTSVQISDGTEPLVGAIYRYDARTFGAAANDPAGEIASYAWDLDGDGQFDDLVSPTADSATLPSAAVGSFELGVRVTAADGRVAIAHHLAVIRGDAPIPPLVSSDPPQPRAGDRVLLNATSNSDDIVKTEWDFDGDGAYEVVADEPLFGFTSYPAPGTHVVRVRVTDSQGRSAAGRGEVTVSPGAGNRAPYVMAEPSTTSARVGASVTFTEASLDADGTIAARDWDLDGDGEFDDLSGPGSTTVTFPSAGTHLVGLRVTDDKGATATNSVAIDVHTENLPPRARILPAGATVLTRPGRPVPVSGGADSSDDALAAFAWDLDEDGQFDDSTDAATSASFATPGLHRVRLQVTDAGGLTGTATLLVDVRAAGVNAAPQLQVSVPGTARPGVGVKLSATAFDADGDPVVYDWDADGDGAFDDGTTPELTFAYPGAGTAEVRVRARDGQGGERIETRSITIALAADVEPEIAEFGLLGPARAGHPASFAALAAAADGTGDEVALTFDLDGDGAFDDVPAPDGYNGFTWTFPTAAPVTVALKATGANGRFAVRALQLRPGTENLAPDAWILASSAVLAAGRPVDLMVLWYDPDGSAATFAWDLDGDGQYDDGTEEEATLSVPVAGTHTFGVRVTDAEGASVTVTQTVTVGSRPPVASFTISDDTPAAGQAVTFTSTASDPDGGAPASQAWDLDDDGAFDDATGPAATATFLPGGTPLVGLKVRDAGGDNGVRYAKLTVAGAEPTPTATPTPTPPPFPPPPPPQGAAKPDTTAPGLSVAPKAARLGALLARGLAVSLRCTEGCRVTVVATVDKATAKRLKLGGSREVGRASRSLAGGATVALPVKLSAKARKAAKRRRTLKLTLTVTAIDAAGNTTVVKKSVTVRR